MCIKGDQAPLRFGQIQFEENTPQVEINVVTKSDGTLQVNGKDIAVNPMFQHSEAILAVLAPQIVEYYDRRIEMLKAEVQRLADSLHFNAHTHGVGKHIDDLLLQIHNYTQLRFSVGFGLGEKK